MKCQKIALLLIVFLLIPLAFAAPHIKEGKGVYVQNKDFKVKAIEETVYCTNVWSDEGCLFKAEIEITSKGNNNRNVVDKIDYDKRINVKEVQEKTKKKSRNLDKAKGKNFRTEQRQIRKGVTELVELEFWSWESGKYNYTLEYAGISLTLDPFFNITSNTSSSSPYLYQSSDFDGDDSTFSSQVDYSSFLFDQDDDTGNTTLLGNNGLETIEGELLYRFEEGSGTTAFDSFSSLDGTISGSTYASSKGTNGTGEFALDFDGVNDYVTYDNFGVNITDTFSFGGWIYRDVDAASVERIISLSDATNTVGSDFALALYVRGSFNDFQCGATGQDEVEFYRDSAGSVAVGEWVHVVCVSDGSTLNIYENGVLNNQGSSASPRDVKFDPDFDVDVGRLGYNGAYTYNFNGRIDEAFILNDALNATQVSELYENGLEVLSSGFKPFFDVSINDNNNHWLRVKKTTSGTVNASVYRYDSPTTIDTSTVDSAILNTGWDVIPLSNTIINDTNVSFRLFTSTPSFISELQLITELEDTQNPIISNETVNTTVLTCNDSVRLSAVVTDDNQVSQVDFTYSDFTGTNQVMADRLHPDSDIFFYDITYSQSTSGTDMYNFTQVDAEDIVGNTDTSSITVQYNYTCITADTTPPIITPSIVVNNTIIDKRITNQTVNYSITDNIGILNTSWIIYNSSGVVTSNDIVFNTSETSQTVINEVDISNLGAGDYFIDRIAYDTSNNPAVYVSGFTIVDFDTLVTLLSPGNNTGVTIQIGSSSEFADFTWQAIGASSCNLYINDTVVGGITDPNANIFDVSETLSLTFSENQTIKWNVDCNIIGQSINSSFHILDITYSPKPENQFQVGVCPTDTTPNTLFIGLLFLIAFSLVILGLILSIDILSEFMGIMGGILLLILSWYVAGCIAVFAWFIAALGLVLVMWFGASMLLGGGPSRMRIF